MKQIILFTLLFFIFSCNDCVTATYEVKFKNGTSVYVEGYDSFMDKNKGFATVWTNKGDHTFNYDEVLYIIKQ